jgi:diguanylate cyclase (GGDEF)-like protein
VRTRGGDFAVDVLDSLSAHIAVLDADGRIISVNEAWRTFARCNGGGHDDYFIGVDYVESCEAAASGGDGVARQMAAAIRDLLAGHDTEFQIEYPCHSPDQQRWFVARVSPFVWHDHRYVVVAHENITDRKLAELELLSAKQELEQTNQLLAQALERETVLARTDALTALNNRRYFMKLARHEFSAAMRYAQPMSIALIDIDHFKRVNDSYGHQQGDHVLQKLAAIIRTEVRDSDLSARFGGEEFIVLLRNTDEADALTQLERLRLRIESAQIPAGAGIFHVTASIGVAQMLASDSLDALIGRADAALYRAKASGRNRVALATTQESVQSLPTTGAEPEF